MNQSIKRISVAALALTCSACVSPLWGQTDSLVETNPSIIALEESDPKTPEQLLFAMQITLGFDRMDAMQGYAQQLLALDPDETAQLALHRRFGSPIFLELRDADQFGPELAAFAGKVLETVGKDARREDRVRQMAEEATADDEATRRGAVIQLKRAGASAAPILLNMLANSSDAPRQDRLRVALMALGRDSVRPMIAALRSDNAMVVSQVSRALGRMEIREAVPHLVAIAVGGHPSADAAVEAIQRIVGAAPNKKEVIIYLQRKIEGYRGGNLPDRPDLDDKITFHTWDNDANTTVASRLDIEPARYREAALLSTDLMALSKNPNDIQNALLVRLQDLQLRAGEDRPIDQNSPEWKLASETRPEVLEKALVEALRRNWVPAASAALQALGASGEVTLVDSADGQPRPIAKALSHSDRRVRYAAARAIMKLDPSGPYPGSSSLLDTLEFLVRSSGTSRVLVGNPSRGRAQTLVGLVGVQGYRGASATTGRELIRKAQKRPDLEFILLSSMLSGPGAAETIHLLRQDPRTANLPAAIYAMEDRLEYAEQLAKEDALTIAMPRLHSVAGAAVHLSRLEALQTDRTPQASRVIQAGAALRLLAQMAEDRNRYGMYEIFRCEDAVTDALRLPALNAPAAKMLGLFGTERSQMTLVASALDRSLSDAERENAFKAFNFAVDSRGLMLTNSETRRLRRELQFASFDDATSLRIRKPILDLINGVKSKQQSDPKEEKAGAGE